MILRRDRSRPATSSGKRTGGTVPVAEGVPAWLVPPAGRTAAVALVLAAATVGGLLAVRYRGTSEPGRIDREIAEVLVGWPPALRIAVGLGDPAPLAIMTLLVAVGAALMGRGVVLALVAPICAVLASHVVLKPLVGRTIGEGLAYPSTHMTGVAAVLVVIGVLVFSRSRNGLGLRSVTAALLLVVAAVYAGTLSALGYHYPTDTIGGVCLALAVVVTCALVLDMVTGLARRGRSVTRGGRGHVR